MITETCSSLTVFMTRHVTDCHVHRLDCYGGDTWRMSEIDAIIRAHYPSSEMYQLLRYCRLQRHVCTPRLVGGSDGYELVATVFEWSLEQSCFQTTSTLAEDASCQYRSLGHVGIKFVSAGCPGRAAFCTFRKFSVSSTLTALGPL